MKSLDDILRIAINFKEAAVDAANAESDGFEVFTARANEILDTYIEMSKQQIREVVLDALSLRNPYSLDEDMPKSKMIRTTEKRAGFERARRIFTDKVKEL